MADVVVLVRPALRRAGSAGSSPARRRSSRKRDQCPPTKPQSEAKREQREDDVAEAEVPGHRVAADLGADDRGDDAARRAPSGTPGRQIPDADRRCRARHPPDRPRVHAGSDDNRNGNVPATAAAPKPRPPGIELRIRRVHSRVAPSSRSPQETLMPRIASCRLLVAAALPPARSPCPPRPSSPSRKTRSSTARPRSP